MSEEIMVLETTAVQAVSKTRGSKYDIRVGNNLITLQRDVDFGKFGRAKSPCLLKSGAEKIVFAYGLLQHHNLTINSNLEGNNPYIHVIDECKLVKVDNLGNEHVISNGFGSANTMESRNGTNGVWNASNSTIKMAQKRALVAAALAISGLSDLFTQDMENESFIDGNMKNLLDTDKPESPVSTAQIKRLYAVGGEAGLTSAEVKQWLAAQGITSTKQILQKDYDSIIEKLKLRGEQNG